MKMSKEHVIRSALRKFLPQIDSEKKALFTESYLDTKTGTPRARQYEAPVGPFDQTSNKVCKTCNETWLDNDVESPVESLLGEFMQGQIQRLDHAGACRLALWASKTAAVRTLLDRGPISLPPEHFRHIKEKLEPPPNTRVYAALLDESLAWDRNVRHTLTPTGRKATPSHLTTLILGKMALFVTGFSDQQAGDLRYASTFQRLKDAGAVQVWPLAQPVDLGLRTMRVEAAKFISAPAFPASAMGPGSVPRLR